MGPKQIYSKKEDGEDDVPSGPSQPRVPLYLVDSNVTMTAGKSSSSNSKAKRYLVVLTSSDDEEDLSAPTPEIINSKRKATTAFADDILGPSNAVVPKICSRNRCVEGTIKKGERVSFSTKSNGQFNKTCDQCCRESRTIWNPKNNPKNNPKMQKAANEAREAGMCPGYKDIGCPLKAKAPVVNSRQKIYCSNCQEKVAANNYNVLESHRKAAERTEGIIVAVPHAESLKTLGVVKIRSLLPATSVSMLQKDLVGIDTSTSGGKGSCDWEDLNGLGGVFVDSSGLQHTFFAKRTYATQRRSIEGKWSVSIDGATAQSLFFIPMLKSFAKWCSGRIICYHTAAAECDFKRLTSVFTEKTASLVFTVNPFPPFETGWLNDIYRHLIGPKKVPIESTYWKLSIIHDDLYSLKSDSSVYSPLDAGIVSVPANLTNVVSDASKTWNLALLVKLILSQLNVKGIIFA